jgi:phosphatidylserine/phosphatidylglycerophosphate/cardiolipin synthase-like enzyme
MAENVSYKIDELIPLHSSAYSDYLLKEILSAKKSIYAMVFIVDPRVFQDVNLNVRAVFSALNEAKNKGVDVKVIVGTSSTESIYLACYVAKRCFERLAINVKSYQSTKESLHSKLVIIDDDVSMIGSPNWTEGGLGQHIEDSVGIKSKTVNKYLKTRFLKLWESSSE